MATTVLDKQREAMEAHGMDAMLVISPENVAWTSGILVPSQKIVQHRHAIVIVPKDHDPEMIVVTVEEQLAREKASIKNVTAYNEFTQVPILMAAERLRELGYASGNIGLEVSYLNQEDFRKLTEALPEAHIEPIDKLLKKLRIVKTQEEIEKLTFAAQLAERVDRASLSTWWPGMTEADLYRTIVDNFISGGGDKLTMPSVTSGERTPMLNGGPTEREIKWGDVIRIDCIGLVNDYTCDVARTAVVGEPTPEQKELWQKLVDCRNTALSRIKPGVSSHSIFKEYIDNMNAWELPTLNFLGHGLGLTLHEEPYLNPYADTALQKDMVLAIEPLVTFPDLGMQLEEAVLVTDTGYELITNQFDTSQLWQMREA